MMDDNSYLTTKEAASFLGISPSTLYRIERKGLLISSRDSRGNRRFSIKNLEDYLKVNQNSKCPEEETNINDLEVREQALELYKASKPFFNEDNIWIYNADILEFDGIGDESIDLIITSPPYNVDIIYNSHNDRMSYDEYLVFTEKWLKKCFSYLKEDGRFCLNIPLDKNKGGQQSVYADVTTIAKEIGYKYHSTIIWNEQNISRRTAWGSWLSATAPYVIAPVEVIVVFYKKLWKKTSGSGISDISRKEFIEWTNGVWTFYGESKKRVGHPAPFPVELPKRCIKLFSFVNDVVLDPFCGSGSTLLACLQTKRQGIGVDIDLKYCQLAKERLLKEGKIPLF